MSPWVAMQDFKLISNPFSNMTNWGWLYIQLGLWMYTTAHFPHPLSQTQARTFGLKCQLIWLSSCNGSCLLSTPPMPLVNGLALFYKRLWKKWLAEWAPFGGKQIKHSLLLPAQQYARALSHGFMSSDVQNRGRLLFQSVILPERKGGEGKKGTANCASTTGVDMKSS